MEVILVKISLADEEQKFQFRVKSMGSTATKWQSIWGQ